MYYGTKMPDFGDVWRELQKDAHGNEVTRVIDDGAELDFWKHYVRDRAGAGPDQYCSRIWMGVEDILGGKYYDSILEIGPGWGNYTLDLASRCKSMSCLDISPDILRFIRGLASSHGLRIHTINKKLEDYRGAGADVVFAFNCFYRMRDIEYCLERINRLGEIIHIIGMTSGPEQEYLRDFDKKLGLEIRYNRLDYILLVNILYQMGIDCNVRIIELEKDYLYESVEKAARKASQRILSGNWEEDDIIHIMRRYVRPGDDGMYHYVHHFKAALIYW